MNVYQCIDNDGAEADHDDDLKKMALSETGHLMIELCLDFMSHYGLNHSKSVLLSESGFKRHNPDWVEKNPATLLRASQNCNSPADNAHPCALEQLIRESHPTVHHPNLAVMPNISSSSNHNLLAGSGAGVVASSNSNNLMRRGPFGAAGSGVSSTTVQDRLNLNSPSSSSSASSALESDDSPPRLRKGLASRNSSSSLLSSSQQHAAALEQFIRPAEDESVISLDSDKLNEICDFVEIAN